MMRNDSPASKVSSKSMTIQMMSLTNLLRIANYPNPVLNEMWFLTIDPFVGIPVFIAKVFRATILLACFRGLS